MLGLGAVLFAFCFVELLEVAFPDRSIAFEPFVGFGEGLAFDSANVRATHNAATHKSRVFQNADVLRRRRERHSQRRRQRRQVQFAPRQPPQHRPPSRMRQSMKDPVEHGRSIINHVV